MEKIFLIILGIIVILGGGIWFWTTFNNTTPAPASSLQVASTTITQTQATSSTATTTNATTTVPSNITEAILHTSMGDITIQFYPDQAPITVANFIKLAESGFYNGTKFHRVIEGFMDQGGDPLTKNDADEAQWGTGGPGYTIPDEITPSNNNVAGSIAMANTGQPNSGSSQFFINAVNNPSLNSAYTVFGQTIAGMSVVTAINNVPVDSQDRPLTPVVLESITLK